MVIKVGVVFIILSFVMYKAQSTDLANVLPHDGPAEVVLEGNVRTYNRNVGVVKCCMGNGYEDKTKLAYWNTISPADVSCAAQIAWHFARYQIAPMFWSPAGLDQGAEFLDPMKDFPRKAQPLFTIDNDCSTNMTVRIFPFKVSNDVSRTVLYCCLVTLYGKRGFHCGIYVSMNNGRAGLDFREVSGCVALVSRETYCPYLSLSEFEVQDRLWARIPRERLIPKEKYKPTHKDTQEKIVDVEVDI